MRYFVLGCLALLMNPAFAQDAATVPATVIAIEPDIVFGTGDGTELKLDLARPITDKLVGPNGAPCVVVIHGGAWRMGDKAKHRGEILRFADDGFVSVTVQYRFAPQYRFPAQVEDVKCAVRFLRAHASDYGIDPDRIGAVGFSAGAHLALMLATLDADEFDGVGGSADQSSKVQAAVSFYGPTMFTADDMPARTAPLVLDFLGGTKDEVPDAYASASPVTHLDADDPPMLLFQGTADPLVPFSQAFAMTNAMARHEVDGRVELLIGAGHGWGGVEGERSYQVTRDFFLRHLSTNPWN